MVAVDLTAMKDVQTSSERVFSNKDRLMSGPRVVSHLTISELVNLFSTLFFAPVF